MSSNSKATSSASGSANSTNSSTDTSSIKTLYYAAGCFALALGAFGYSFYNSSTYLGSKDNWNELQPVFPSIYIPVIIGTIILCIALGIYMSQMMSNPNILYMLMVISILALGFSYTAVAMAVLTKAS